MKLNVREIAIFSMLGALIYASKMIMEVLPNIHLIGTFIVAMTVVYRQKALYPIYIFVFITGLLNGTPYYLHGIDVLYAAVCSRMFGQVKSHLEKSRTAVSRLRVSEAKK